MPVPLCSSAAQWAALTRRSVALCRQDRALWTRCMARADALQAAGTDPLTAVRRALDEPVTLIIDALKSTLDKTPPELAADIMDRGVVLAGGGALLQGLDDRVRHETQIPVHLADSPLTCVAVGSGRSLEEFEVIHRASRSRAARRNGLLRY